MGSSTPKDDADQSQSDAGDSIYDGVKVMNRITLSDKDFEVQMTEVGLICISGRGFHWTDWQLVLALVL